MKVERSEHALKQNVANLAHKRKSHGMRHLGIHFHTKNLHTYDVDTQMSHTITFSFVSQIGQILTRSLTSQRI